MLLPALLGLLAGAIAGVFVAFALVLIWYDVLHIGDHGGDGLSGASSFMALALLLAVAGGLAGAMSMVRRANAAAAAGRSGGAMWPAFILLLVLGIAGLWLAGLVAL